MNSTPEFEITHRNFLYRPKSQGEYPIPESDWRRLKRRIEQIVPHKRIFEIIASIMSGIAVQSLFSLFAFYSVEILPKWILLATWIIFVVSVVLAPAFYFLDRLQKNIISVSVNSVLDDMNFIEENFHYPNTGVISAELTSASLKVRHPKQGSNTLELCSRGGVYKCVSHPKNQISLNQGDKFPPCSGGGGHFTYWELMKNE